MNPQSGHHQPDPTDPYGDRLVNQCPPPQKRKLAQVKEKVIDIAHLKGTSLTALRGIVNALAVNEDDVLVGDDCTNNGDVKWHRCAVHVLARDRSIVRHESINARLLHSRRQAPTLRLLEVLHHPRPTAAEALDIVVLVNVLRECHQAPTNLLFHVVQAASR